MEVYEPWYTVQILGLIRGLHYVKNRPSCGFDTIDTIKTEVARDLWYLGIERRDIRVSYLPPQSFNPRECRGSSQLNEYVPEGRYHIILIVNDSAATVVDNVF